MNATQEKKILTPLDSVTIGPVATIKPHKFFATREDLYVWDRFADRVLSIVRGEAILSERITLQFYILPESANDATIQENLLENHIFGADELCTILAHLINIQPNGKEGHLLSNGYANLFYVLGKDNQFCVVPVYWSAGSRRWCVGAWDLDDDAWSAGSRVFSCLSA